MNLSEIRDRAFETRQSALRATGPLPAEVSVDRFLAAAAAVGKFDHYKFFPAPALEIARAVESSAGESGGRAFLKAVLAQAIVELIDSRRIETLPANVLRHHILNLVRMAADTDLEADWLNLSNDLFHKDFGLATLRLYAAGAQLVDFRCGIPRSIVARGGMTQLPGRLATMLKLGGFRPYFQIHTHLSYLETFNPEGWDDCYRCCAELYALHPDVLGMFGSSWFYDPALDAISPRLAYLRHAPIEGGAHLMFFENGGDAIGNAISSSPTRRKLYDEGKYLPRSFMLIWGKSEQLRWARSHP